MPTRFSRCKAKQLTSSDYVTASGVKGILFGYRLLGGTTASSVIFNNGGSSGTALWKDSIKAQTAAGDDGVGMFFNTPIAFSSDIYATIAGTGATLSICYMDSD